jgi:hypothetical protein
MVHGWSLEQAAEHSRESCPLPIYHSPKEALEHTSLTLALALTVHGRPEDLQYASMENFLGWCGLQVYHEYQTQVSRKAPKKQIVIPKCRDVNLRPNFSTKMVSWSRQLHRDVNVKDVVGEKCYSTHFIGGDERVGLFLMDQR